MYTLIKILYHLDKQSCFCLKLFFKFCLLLLGNLPNSVLLIGYYHDLLLRDIDADLLVEKMLSTKLLNADEQRLVSSGDSLHHRNWLLLDHVRHLDSQSLLIFSELVQDMWPHVGLQLVTGNIC